MSFNMPIYAYICFYKLLQCSINLLCFPRNAHVTVQKVSTTWGFDGSCFCVVAVWRVACGLEGLRSSFTPDFDQLSKFIHGVLADLTICQTASIKFIKYYMLVCVISIVYVLIIYCLYPICSLL